MGQASSATLSFPDGPKLELDQLIDELVERAQGVKRVQGRLRTLLRAIEVVNDELSLDAVLRHIAEAACLLAGARYGALGVIADDGGLDRFVHVGIGDAQAARIGSLPEGKGLLGALTVDPRPIRSARIADDPRSTGFPPHHPPMTSFLGVPIRVRGEAFGNLYLTESEHGGFSDEDEELIHSLALTAGVAIANARLYDESRRQQRWLAASAEISAGMLAGTDDDPLTTIARATREILDADQVSVSLTTADGLDLLVEVAIGAESEELAGRRFPLAGTAAETVLRTRDPATSRTGVLLPLLSKGGVHGVLEIVRRAGRAAFNPSDVAIAVGFAGHSSVALEFARARADQQRMALFEDRDRIARDLHDHVIQQLFAIGLSLEGLAMTIGSQPDAAEKLRARVQDLDGTIRQIRTSIFELRGPLVGAGDGLRTDVLALTADLAGVLGFAPHVVFAGQVDLLVDDARAVDVLACVREGLTNVAKHAHADRVDLALTVVGDELQLTIADNGEGMSDSPRRSGLDNLRARAQTYGGTFEIRSRPSTGTELTWKVLIR